MAATQSDGGRPALRRAVFIDKDGTLVVDSADRVDPASLAFVPHAFEGLRLLQDDGFALVVVTNQPGIALQRFTRAQFAELQSALTARLFDEGIVLAGFYVCPHRPDASSGPACLCRKPAPGMLHQAAVAHRLDLGRSWMVGDTLDDVEAGHRAGCRALLLDVGNETAWRRSPLREPDHRCGDLLEAARTIVGAERSRLAPGAAPDARAAEQGDPSPARLAPSLAP